MNVGSGLRGSGEAVQKTNSSCPFKSDALLSFMKSVRLDPITFTRPGAVCLSRVSSNWRSVFALSAFASTVYPAEHRSAHAWTVHLGRISQPTRPGLHDSISRKSAAKIIHNVESRCRWIHGIHRATNMILGLPRKARSSRAFWSAFCRRATAHAAAGINMTSDISLVPCLMHA